MAMRLALRPPLASMTVPRRTNAAQQVMESQHKLRSLDRGFRALDLVRTHHDFEQMLLGLTAQSPPSNTEPSVSYAHVGLHQFSRALLRYLRLPPAFVLNHLCDWTCEIVGRRDASASHIQRTSCFTDFEWKLPLSATAAGSIDDRSARCERSAMTDGPSARVGHFSTSYTS